MTKTVLIGFWLSMPLLLWASPGLFGLIEPGAGFEGFVRDAGLKWMALGAAGLLFRTVHLFPPRT